MVFLYWDEIPSPPVEKLCIASLASSAPQTTQRATPLLSRPKHVGNIWDPFGVAMKRLGPSGDAEVVSKRRAVSGGGASVQTGNTLEWQSAASFHKQRRSRAPDIYDLWSEWQRRPDPGPSLRVCPIVTRLNLPKASSSFFPRQKHQTVCDGCHGAWPENKSHESSTLGRGKEGRGHHGKQT